MALKVSDKEFNKGRIPLEKKIKKSHEIPSSRSSSLLVEKPVEKKEPVVIQNNNDDIVAAIKGIEFKSDNSAIAKQIGDKIDRLNETIKNRPKEFEFDIKRNNNGLIKTVLVKPIR